MKFITDITAITVRIAEARTCITRRPRWSQWMVGIGVPMALQCNTTSEPRVAVTTSPSRGVLSKNRSRRLCGSDDVGWTTATINNDTSSVTTAFPHLRPTAFLAILSFLLTLN